MTDPARALFLLLLALPATVAPALAFEEPVPARRPITHEDVFLMQRVGAPEVSPDGRWAAFTVKQPAYDKEQESTDIWVVPMAGTDGPRQLTFTRAAESDLAWSPDSTRLAFCAKREGDEQKQVYVLDLEAGGEARRVTDLSGGANSPVWRPDGRALLVTSMVQPGTQSDAENRNALAAIKARPYNVRVYDEFPTRQWDRWLDERQPTLYLVPLDDAPEPRDLLGGSALRRRSGFGGRFESTGDAERLDATFSPDGDTIIFAATANRHEAARAKVLYALWSVAAEGSEPHRLTGGEGSYALPAFGPSGVLYATFTPSGKASYNATHIARVEEDHAAGSPPTLLTAGFDRSVVDFVLTTDGSTLYLLADDRGSRRLFELAASGGEAIRELSRFERGYLDGLGIGGIDSPVVAATWQNATSPPEIVGIDPGTGSLSALSAFNASRIATIDWQPLREFWFEASTGRRIQSFLALPPGFDPSQKYPLFVLIHGGPAVMMGDEFGRQWNYHLLARPGYVVLFSNYTGSTGYGEAFSQAIDGDTLRGPASEINEAADEAIRRFAFIDGSRQAAGGASYGGALVSWLAVTTRRYRALVSHAGTYDPKTQWSTRDSGAVYSRELRMGGAPWEKPDLWARESPFYYSERLHAPVLLSFGEKDFRVPLNNGLEFWTALKRQEVPSRLLIFPDEGHRITGGENSRFLYSEVHAWLKRYLQ